MRPTLSVDIKSSESRSGNLDSNPEYKIRILDSSGDFDGKFLSAWEDLECRAIEPNGYLSPHFVIPAIKHIIDKVNLLGIIVEKTNRGGYPQLSGVGLFHTSGASKHFPLPHLTAFSSRHSLLSGLLVDQDSAETIVRSIFKQTSNFNNKWHGLVFHDQINEGELATTESTVTQDLGMKWENFREWHRPILCLKTINDEAGHHMGKSMKKSIHRSMKRLEELGTVQWRIRCKETLTDSALDSFMFLENLGWKGEGHTSILSNNADKNFFLEMMKNFSQSERAFITELTLNERPISSTVNFASGGAGFAFKIGWDPHYAKYSPGILNEASWLESNDPTICDLNFIDSGCSDETSYLSNLWNQKRAMRSGVYAITPQGKLALPFVGFAARVKNFIRNRKKQHKTNL